MEVWVAMLVIWVVIEFIQFLRKRPLSERMKTGAKYSAILAGLMLVGQQGRDVGWLGILIAFAMTAGVALAILWARKGLAKVWASAHLIGKLPQQAFVPSGKALG